MGLIVRLIDAFAKSKTGVKLYKWAASPKGQKFTATTLPTIESAFATSMYIIATDRQKNLDKREKNILQWQNVLSGVIGIVLGTYLNNKIFDFGEEIIGHLNAEKIPDVHKISGAIRVASSILITAFLMRFILPTVTAYISGVIEEQKAKQVKKELNILV